MVEIYMEKLRDLLDNSKSNLRIREDKVRGIYIEDSTEIFVSSPAEIFSIIEAGNANRAVGMTVIFYIIINFISK